MKFNEVRQNPRISRDDPEPAERKNVICCGHLHISRVLEAQHLTLSPSHFVGIFPQTYLSICTHILVSWPCMANVDPAHSLTAHSDQDAAS